MSGKPKNGFDWAKWDTHFDDDPKIDKLLDAQGGTGFYIYFWLCQKASANGYYYQWSYADAATTARKMAGRIRSETVKATVGTCCQVGLFDKRLLECEGILTSKRIQRNYVDGVSKGNRSFRRVVKRFWLLDEPETAAGKITFFESEIPDVGDSYAENADVLIENADVLIENGPKKRKEQNSNSGGSGNARASELGKVMDFYLGHFPLPSENVRDGLKSYTEALSADVVLHVLQYAIDEHKTGWGYILAVLQRYHRDGLTTIGDVEEDERRYRAAKQKRQFGGGTVRKQSYTFYDAVEEMKKK